MGRRDDPSRVLGEERWGFERVREEMTIQEGEGRRDQVTRL